MDMVVNDFRPSHGFREGAVRSCAFLFAAGALLSIPTALAGDLTVVSWGGAYTKSQVEAYHKPWMAGQS